MTCNSCVPSEFLYSSSDVQMAYVGGVAPGAMIYSNLTAKAAGVSASEYAVVLLPMRVLCLPMLVSLMHQLATFGGVSLQALSLQLACIGWATLSLGSQIHAQIRPTNIPPLDVLLHVHLPWKMGPKCGARCLTNCPQNDIMALAEHLTSELSLTALPSRYSWKPIPP
jgi:hypothetical protein